MKIPYSKQFIDYQDIKHVSKALRASLITGGDYVKHFENQLKKKINSKFVNCCSSGTSGIYLVMKAIDIKKNDVVIMPAINFIASYSAAKNLNAKVFLADVDPVSGQMTPKSLLECIKKNKLKKIKLIVTMYLGGSPNNVYEFYKIKKKYNSYLLEDACHAFGSIYKVGNKKYNVGECKHSDFAVFSFHPVKTITTGEGGAVCTNLKIISDKIRSLTSHGMIKKYYWDYDINSLSFNFRLSDINAALGISQLKKISRFVYERRKAHNYYLKKIRNDFILNKNIDINENKIIFSAHHLFIVSFKKECRFDRKKFVIFMNKRNIFPQFHYKPIYKFSAYKDNKKELKNTEFYFKNAISLPLYFKISRSTQDKVIHYIKKYLINKNI